MQHLLGRRLPSCVAAGCIDTADDQLGVGRQVAEDRAAGDALRAVGDVEVAIGQAGQASLQAAWPKRFLVVPTGTVVSRMTRLPGCKPRPIASAAASRAL